MTLRPLHAALSGLGTFLLAALAPAAQEPQVLPDPPDPSRVVITIDGRPIPAGLFTSWLMQHRGELMARTYARDWLVEREAIRLGLGVTNQEVHAAVEESIAARVQGTFAGDREAWVRSLQRVGRSELGLLKQRYIEERRELLAFLVSSLDRVVPPEKVVRDWERAYGPGGVRLRVRTLELPFLAPTVPIDASEAEAEALLASARETARRDAEAVRAELLAGADLGTVARERGRNPGKAPRGGLPFLAEEWSEEIAAELLALEEGAISRPFFERSAFVLFEVTKRVVTPFEDVEDELRRRLEEAGPESDEVAARVRGLVEAATIEILPSMWAPPPSGALERPADEVVMVIDGTPIRRAEYQLWLVHSEGEQMVTRFVDYFVVDELAREAGLHGIDEAELESRVDESFALAIEFQHDGKEDLWRQAILSTNRTLEGWRRETRLRVARDMLAERLYLAERVVHPSEVRGEWLNRYGPEGRLIDASVIQLDTPLPGEGGRGRRDGGEDASEATLERLLALRERAQAGEDFAELARAHSDGHNAADGGRFANGLRAEQWPSHVVEEVLALEPGGVSGPLQVGSSWFLFQLHGVEERPFESVREELHAELEVRRPNEVELAGFRNVSTRDLVVKVLPALFDETRE